MKLLIALIATLSVSSIYSQSGGTNNDVLKLFIDLRTQGTNPFNTWYLTSDKYYIIFSSHDRLHDFDPKVNSFGGHAWIVWAHENPQTKSSTVRGYGFWPDRDKIDSKSGEETGNIIIGSTAIPTGLLYFRTPGRFVATSHILVGGKPGEVPGRLQQDLFGVPYSSSMKQVVFEVDKSTYDQSQGNIDTYGSGGVNYKLLEKDCVTFFIDVGKSIGLDMPDRNLLSPKSWFPSDYMNKFIERIKNTTSTTVNGKKGKITAKIDGTYNVDLGDSKGGNSNSGTLDKANNIVEIKIREGKATSKVVNYPNGDTWYQESAIDNTIKLTNPDGTSQTLPMQVSEYRFKNGNTIVSYNPQKFDPRFVPVNLSSGTQDYLGSINNEGVPNGEGTLRTMIPNGNNAPTIQAQTGKFVNGKMIDYTGVKTDEATMYGEFIDGQLTGNARIEFNDGRIFTGQFDKGLANGPGTGSNKKNDHVLTGNFKNGFADGFCTSKNQNGTYKGEYINGECTGQGTWWTPDNKVYEGTFLKGRLINGKATLPNGEHYIGTFDSKGNPNGGKFYDKNGNEKRDRDGGNGAGGDRNGNKGSNDKDCMVCGVVDGKVDCWQQ